MRVLAAAKDEVVAVGFVPGRAAITVGYADAGTFTWDLASSDPPSGKALNQRFFPHSLVFTPDGQGILRRGAAGLVAINLATGEGTEFGPTSERLADFALTPDGSRLVLAPGSTWSPKKLSGWGATAGGWVRDWEFGSGSLRRGLALSPAGDRLAYPCLGPPQAGVRSDLVAVRDAITGAELARAESPYLSLRQLQFRPDGGQLVGIHEMTLVVWPVPRMGEPRLVRNVNRKHFTSAAYHPAGRCLFTTSNDATVLVWDTNTWEPVTRFSWNVGRLRSVAVSADGALAAAGSDKGQVVVWDVDL